MAKVFLLSFDDGTIWDKRLVELLNKYQIPGTFNLNSGLEDFVWEFEGKRVIRQHLALRTTVSSPKMTLLSPELEGRPCPHPGHTVLLSKEEGLEQNQSEREWGEVTCPWSISLLELKTACILLGTPACLSRPPPGHTVLLLNSRL